MRCCVLILALAMLAGCTTTGPETRFGKSAPTSGKRSETPKKAKKTAKKKTKKPAEDRTDRAGSTSSTSNVPGTYKKRQSACESYTDLIAGAAKKYKLEPELVMGIVKVESSFNPECRSRVGARGLMQVMPRTGKHMKCGSDLSDPATNVDCGCRVLRRYLDLYDGNVVYALSAYNAGPGNTNPSHKGSYLPFNFAYVEKVLRWRNVFVRFGCR